MPFGILSEYFYIGLPEWSEGSYSHVLPQGAEEFLLNE